MSTVLFTPAGSKVLLLVGRSLRLFDAATGKELYSSRNLITAPAALTGITVANGRVYVGTRGNNAGDVDSSTSTPGELDIYGLK